MPRATPLCSCLHLRPEEIIKIAVPRLEAHIRLPIPPHLYLHKLLVIDVHKPTVAHGVGIRLNLVDAAQIDLQFALQCLKDLDEQPEKAILAAPRSPVALAN